MAEQFAENVRNTIENSHSFDADFTLRDFLEKYYKEDIVNNRTLFSTISCAVGRAWGYFKGLVSYV